MEKIIKLVSYAIATLIYIFSFHKLIIWAARLIASLFGVPEWGVILGQTLSIILWLAVTKEYVETE